MAASQYVSLRAFARFHFILYGAPRGAAGEDEIALTVVHLWESEDGSAQRTEDTVAVAKTAKVKDLFAVMVERSRALEVRKKTMPHLFHDEACADQIWNPMGKLSAEFKGAASGTIYAKYTY